MNVYVSTTPAVHRCHRFFVIASVIDTGFKFIAGVTDTCDQISLVSLIRVCEMSMDVPFHISSNDTISSRVNFSGCVWLRQQEISLFWFVIFWLPQGPLTGFVICLWIPLFMAVPMTYILLSSHGGVLILATQFTVFSERTNLCCHNTGDKFFPSVVGTGQK